MIPAVKPEVAKVIGVHSAAGRRFEAGGVRSFVREQGSGPVVVLVHGVPSSSFLYRKLIDRLADQGVHAVAFDFPGLGLADRPQAFDYSWSGLSEWMGAAIDALGHDRVHLVVHDVGGPIACEWAIRNPERTLSVTALNTMLDVAEFRRPWPMQPFAIRGLGELWLRATPPVAFALMMRQLGIADRGSISRAELLAYHALLLGSDRGRAFLRIMRGFDLSEAKQRFFEAGLAARTYPARVIWGELDPVLGRERMDAVQRILGADEPLRLPAKHFLQEDQAPAIGYAIADLVAPLG